jgi:hypothetical protein
MEKGSFGSQIFNDVFRIAREPNERNRRVSSRYTGNPRPKDGQYLSGLGGH